ncbi:MAG: hypothetical protein ACXVP0_02085 [Bacteroidia bacterium]
MYTLSDQQIDYILSDIRRRGVEMEDLQLNLLDHICCIVEQHLEADGDFEGFYAQTIPKFFTHELWEIEEETILLLTFKNYYTMKKIMFSGGFSSAIMLLAGGLFKIMHWPGASVLLLLGTVLFSLLFLPMMFTLRLKEKTERRDKTVLLIGLFTSIFLLFSALFKIMHWPGASIMGVCAIATLLLVFVPVYLVSGLRNPDTKVNTIITSILIIAGSGFLLILPGRGPSLIVQKMSVNAMMNEETIVSSLRSSVKLDSADKSISENYTAFMSSADKLKDAISNIISGKDYRSYLQNSDDIRPGDLTPDYLREMPETKNYINALVGLEAKLNSPLYAYDGDIGYENPTRNAKLDYAMRMQENLKSLMNFISNTQEQACLLVNKK